MCNQRRRLKRATITSLASGCFGSLADGFSKCSTAEMAQPFPTIIPGLRSPFEKVGGIVYFGRMLDKMRLAAAGKLPAGWQATRGTAMKTNLDSRCCNFLRVDYAALEKETLQGEKTDDELLARAFKNGRQPGE